MQMEKLSPAENAMIRDGLLKLEQAYRDTAAQASAEQLPVNTFGEMASEVQALREKLQHTQLHAWDGESQR